LPLQINKPDHAQALTNEFNLKGRVSLDLDETVVPVSIVSDVARSPVQIPIVSGGRALVAAVVAEFGFVGVTAAPNTRLQIDQFIIDDTTGASAFYQLIRLNAAELAGIANINSQGLLNLGFPVGDRVASQFISGTSGGFTNVVSEKRVTANGDSTWEFPAGIFLAADDGAERGAYIIQRSFANQIVSGAVLCREYKLG